MPQWGHEKDAPIDEGDAKKDKSEKDEKKATPSSKLKLNHLKEDGGKVGLLECGLVSCYDAIFPSHLDYLKADCGRERHYYCHVEGCGDCQDRRQA